MAESITLVIPTVGRPTLARTLLSLRRQPWDHYDAVVLVGDGPCPVAEDLWRQFRLPGRYVELPRTPKPDWGHTPRNTVNPTARTEYVAALDDDDVWTPDALVKIREALRENPGRPHLFRASGCPTVGDFWKTEQIALGNVGTPLLVYPTALGCGKYAPVYGGDCDFIRETCAGHPLGPVWRKEVIVNVRPYR